MEEYNTKEEGRSKEEKEGIEFADEVYRSFRWFRFLGNNPISEGFYSRMEEKGLSRKLLEEIKDKLSVIEPYDITRIE